MNQSDNYPITSGVQLIGLSGAPRSGKDTVATFINETYSGEFEFGDETAYRGAYTCAFAEPLKSAAAHMFGIPIHHFYSQDSSVKEGKNEYWNVSPREIAQFVGTEMARDTMSKLIPGISSNFWIAHMAGLLNNQLISEFAEGEFAGSYSEGDIISIPDCRFQNEYDWIIANGGIVIHLSREGTTRAVGIAGHASEAGFNAHTPERTFYVDNNGTPDELFQKIEEILAANGIRKPTV